MPVAVPINEVALKDIAERFGAAFIALFGSAAKGTMTKESDADVAVMADELAEDEDALADWTIALTSALAEAIPHGEGVDVVVLNRAPSLLQFQVARHGILLHERRPNAWLRFKSYAAR
ncbi:MAG: nucleotidyltransferase domain-containing protein, partial [Planctomycetes bacterium]|nr:nucleotidyltransferase domain-containing protein [Planctomycetota bacterium]